MDADCFGHGGLSFDAHLSLKKGYQTPLDTRKRRPLTADLTLMTIPIKFALGLTALLLITFIAYQWYVGAAILGLLFDSVCWVFPVCPKD
jgi:hypothetical protein